MSTTSKTGSGDWLLNAVKHNPEGLLLLAAGAVLMMRKTSLTEGTSDTVSQAASQVRDDVSSYANKAREGAASVASTASDYASQAKSAASDYASQIGEGSERIVRKSKSALQNTVSRIVQDQPLAVAMAGLAAGAAVAAVFPATEIEKQTLGPLREEVSEQAGRLGERMKDATAKAGEKLKDVAQERGMSAVKEALNEVKDAFTDSLSQPSNTGSSFSQSTNPERAGSSGAATTGNRDQG
jgi:ElaB/YqjD/DUF883 family membrane-anchored ribosome-binding protein